MTTDRMALRARRYLLETATEDERAAIEREYFGVGHAVDRMAAVEDDLIEDYLSGELAADERDTFEHNYLAAPRHRRRLDTIRKLIASSGRQDDGTGSMLPAPSMVGSKWSAFQQLALAASLLIAAGAVWMAGRSLRGPRTTTEGTPAVASRSVNPAPERGPVQPPAGLPASRRVIAVSISPLGVRGADDRQSLVIPVRTDVVALRLEGEPGDRIPGLARASIRTVSGTEIWQGAAHTADPLPQGVVALVDVPAQRLRADDYIVLLFGHDAAGLEQERYRYVLRVRSR